MIVTLNVVVPKPPITIVHEPGDGDAIALTLKVVPVWVTVAKLLHPLWPLSESDLLYGDSV